MIEARTDLRWVSETREDKRKLNEDKVDALSKPSKNTDEHSIISYNASVLSPYCHLLSLKMILLLLLEKITQLNWGVSL